MADKWKTAVPQRERPMKETDYVCQQHFIMDDVMNSSVHIGSACHILPKVRPKLRPRAVPSIFPQLENKQPDGPIIDDSEKLQNFRELVTSVTSKTIGLLNFLWGTHFTHDTLAFSRFFPSFCAKGCLCDFGIVFENCLLPMLCVRGKRVKHKILTAIHTVSDLEKLISDTDNLTMCKGYGLLHNGVQQYSAFCSGIVTGTGDKCKKCNVEGMIKQGSKTRKLLETLKKVRKTAKSQKRTMKRSNKVRRANDLP
jgi:hypothetical protein